MSVIHDVLSVKRIKEDVDILQLISILLDHGASASSLNEDSHLVI